MLFRISDARKSYAGNEILRGVSFQVNPGEKVGLVGRNGAGKTTVFKLITGAESADSGEVIKASGLRLGLLDQHVAFNEAETVHTAALSAFKEIHDIEAEMRLLEKTMETDHSESVLNRYAELQEKFEHADGFTYAARAESILQGLGFPKEAWSLDTRTLSGGQKNRLGMARLLLSSSDVLLLDEPTNHLDVNAVEWLENFLTEYDKSYVVISHDRYFLDRTTNRIIEIENGRAVTYKGNYSEFVVERELRREQQQREYENQQAMINKTQEFIRRNLEGQKTKQAKSRRNMLERMERLDAVASEKHGGNFGLKKVERTGNNVLTTEDLAVGYQAETRPVGSVPGIGSPHVSKGSTPPINPPSEAHVCADHTRVLGKNINISLHRGEALGIIGGNGTGKTTLLKTLLGEIRELEGKIFWGTKTNFGYYAQNLEELEPRNEVIQELRRVAPLADNGELRSFLARFLFMGEDVFKLVGDLSGGEKGRLALAKLIYSHKNVLILDEPTNHLDIPAREALEAALEEYDGTIITVSHDRFFLDKIATQILAFEDTGVESFNGNYTEYHDWRDGTRTSVRESSAERVNTDSPDSSVSPLLTSGLAHRGGNASVNERAGRAPEEKAPSAAKPALSKNQRDRIEKRIVEIESEIADLEDRRAKLTAEMSLPDVATDPARVAAITDKYNETEIAIQERYVEWESLAGLEP